MSLLLLFQKDFYKKIRLKNQFCVISYCKIHTNTIHKQQRGVLLFLTNN